MGQLQRQTKASICIILGQNVLNHSLQLFMTDAVIIDGVALIHKMSGNLLVTYSQLALESWLNCIGFTNNITVHR